MTNFVIRTSVRYKMLLTGYAAKNQFTCQTVTAGLTSVTDSLRADFDIWYHQITKIICIWVYLGVKQAFGTYLYLYVVEKREPEIFGFIIRQNFVIW